MIDSGDHLWENARIILKEHQRSLESIEFRVYMENIHEDFDSDHYVRLKKLNLQNYGWWIPRKAPMLEELKLTTTVIRDYPAVLETAPPNLKSSSLTLIEHHTLTTKHPYNDTFTGLGSEHI